MSLFRHVSAVSAANAVNGVLGLVLVPVALSRLGAEGYALLAVHAVLLSYAALLELGLGKHLLQRLSASRDATDARAEVSAVSGAYLVIGGLLLLSIPLLMAAVPALFSIPAGARFAVRVLVVIAVLEYVFGLPLNLMQSRCMADRRFDRYAQFMALSGVLRYSLGFAALAWSVNPLVVIGAMAARRVIEVPFALWWFGGLPPGATRPAAGVRTLRHTIARAGALSMAQMLQITAISAGAVLVSSTSGLAALGVYRAAFDLASKVWFFSNSIGLVSFPYLAGWMSSTDARERLGRALPTVLQASLAAYGVVFVAVTIAAVVLLPLIGMGEAAYPALLSLLLAGVVLNAHCNTPYELLQATGAYWQAVRISVVALAVLLSTFFIAERVSPGFGIGWAWLASQVVMAQLTTRRALSLASAPAESRQKLDMSLVALLLGFVCVSLGLMMGASRWWLLFATLPTVAVAVFLATTSRQAVVQLLRGGTLSNA
jgi:O-antigen/teichoic acid export membrane protein